MDGREKKRVGVQKTKKKAHQGRLGSSRGWEPGEQGGLGDGRTGPGPGACRDSRFLFLFLFDVKLDEWHVVEACIVSSYKGESIRRQGSRRSRLRTNAHPSRQTDGRTRISIFRFSTSLSVRNLPTHVRACVRPCVRVVLSRLPSQSRVASSYLSHSSAISQHNAHTYAGCVG